MLVDLLCDLGERVRVGDFDVVRVYDTDFVIEVDFVTVLVSEIVFVIDIVFVLERVMEIDFVNDGDFVGERVVVEVRRRLVLVLLVFVAGVCSRRAVSVSGWSESGSNARSSFKVCGQLDVSDALS